LLEHGACWLDLLLLGKRAAVYHRSHFKEKVNGCWKSQGERQEKTVNWQETHQSILSTGWYYQYAVLGAGMVSQPCPQEHRLQRLGNDIFLTSLGFSAWTNLVAGHPVTCLYMQSMCSATFPSTINYMYKMQA